MQLSKAQKDKIKEIEEAKIIKSEPKKKKYTDNRMFFGSEIFEVAITGSNFWYKDMQGVVLSVFKSACGNWYKTISPINRKCEYGLISSKECKLIVK